jgi:hypothetical protein
MTAGTGLRGLHALLGVQSRVVVLISLNRLGSWSQGYVGGNQFLRWVDLNNLILSFVSVLAFHLLQRHLLAEGSRWAGALTTGFLVGAYLLGVSYGIHEVTNYLHVRACPAAGEPLCSIIAFNDDEFSHWLFFAGFVMVNASVMLLQIVFPYDGQLRPRDRALIVFNSLFVAAGIFANLAFEEIGLDLYVVVLLAGVAIYLLRRRGLQPLLLYYSVAYVLGLVLTAGKIALS